MPHYNTHYFNIENQTEYTISLTRVNNVEDVDDNFLTREEFVALHANYDRGLPSQTWILTSKVRDAVQHLKQQMIDNNKKSIVITDQELLSILTDSHRSVSYFVPGLRRVGNKLSRYTKPTKKKPTRKDGLEFVGLSFQCIHAQIKGLHLTVGGGYDVVNSEVFTFIKKVMTWKEFEGWYKHYCSTTEWYKNYSGDSDEKCKNALRWFKMVYNDVTMFDRPEK